MSQYKIQIMTINELKEYYVEEKKPRIIRKLCCIAELGSSYPVVQIYFSINLVFF